MAEFQFRVMGETCDIVEFGSSINAETNRKVHLLAAEIAAVKIIGIRETVPTYRSLAVYFDPLVTTRRRVEEKITELIEGMGNSRPQRTFRQGRRIRIPVLYGGEKGPDLEFVAEYSGLSVDEVVRIHTSKPLLVYMLGFLPGFPYLGGMSEEISAPRLEVPRTRIPAGSVGIAGNQTGFYPLDSPGGWRIIGRTPVRAFDPVSEPHFLLSPGDYLQFHSISGAEYDSILRQVLDGTYEHSEAVSAETGL